MHTFTARSVQKRRLAAAALWGLIGFSGVIYAVTTLRRMRTSSQYRPEFEDWIFHCVIPFAAYLALAISAYCALFFPRESLFAVAAASLLLLLAGIHNAWDAVTYHVYVKNPGD